MALSISTALNATLALIRGDMSVVRAQLRAPGVDEGENIPQIVVALLEALEGVKAEAVQDLRVQVGSDVIIKELVAIQVKSLALLPPASYTDNMKSAYMVGVEAIEQLLTDRIREVKWSTGAGRR